MKCSKWIGLLFILLFHLHSVAMGSQFVSGLYKLKGTHSVLGSYEGMLSVNEQGRVQRWVEISPRTDFQLRFVGLESNQQFKVQQLWEGQLTDKGMHFQIRMSNVLTSFNNYQPPVNDFSFEQVSLESLKSSFQLKNDGTYSEHYTLIDRRSKSLFEPEARTKMDASGNTGSFLVNFASWVGVKAAINEYRSLEHFDAYREREEFQNNEIFQIKDLTDLDFYRKNSGILRVRNKSLTPLSIGEALQRRAAYQPTLKEKAEYKEKETRKLTNDLGIFEEGTVDSDGRVLSLRPQGDSALWFGVYIWSLYLQDQVQHSVETGSHLKAAIQSLNHILLVSPDPTKFARWIHKSPPEEVSTDPNVRQGTGIYSQYKYDSRSNNDMVKGILLGYLIAYKSLKKEDAALKKEIAGLVKRLQALGPAQKGSNKAIAHGLDALWNEDVDSLKIFIEGIDNLTTILGDRLYVNSGFHIGGMANPSGIHLNLISQATQYLMAEALLEKVKEAGERMYIPKPLPENPNFNFEDPTPRIKAIKKAAEKNIKLLASRMSKAHFNYLNIAAYGITKDPKLKQKAVDSVYGLIEVPIVRSVGNLRGDLLLQPDWMYSSWPFEPWVAIKGPWSIDVEKLKKKNQRRGVFGYPIFECASMGASYLWVDGTNDFPCGGSANNVGFSADYLWAYWMARAADVIKDED